MSNPTTLTTPNGMIWNYLHILERIISALKEVENTELNNEQQKEVTENIMLVILLSITVVEVFLNMYFQELIQTPEHSIHAKRIKRELKNERYGIYYKIKEWPRLLFGKQIDLTSGIGLRFDTLRARRNELMHFSDMEPKAIDGRMFTKFCDVSIMEKLTIGDAVQALKTVKQTILEILRLEGHEPEALNRLMLKWTGTRYFYTREDLRELPDERIL